MVLIELVPLTTFVNVANVLLEALFLAVILQKKNISATTAANQTQLKCFFSKKVRSIKKKTCFSKLTAEKY